MSQLAFANPYMSLDEVAADVGEGFDSAVRSLEREAMDAAQREDEAAAPAEFRPTRVFGAASDPSSEAVD